MSTIKSLGLVIIIFLISHSLSAQMVNYKIIDDAPQSPKLVAGISIGDMFIHLGEDDEVGSGGPGAFVTFRPTERLKLHGQLSTGLYGMLINGTENYTGIRKAGGLFIDANAEFAWYRKGVNVVNANGNRIKGKFRLKKGTPNYERYINIPYNRLVERTIRGGIYSHTYPFSSATGGYVGIGKYYTNFAKLQVEGETQREGSRLGYSLDYVFAVPIYVDEMRMGDPTGFRFGIDGEYHGLRYVSYRFEFGGMPAVNGMFMRVTFNIGLVRLGSQKYTGDYKEIKQSNSRIVNLFRAL